MRREWLIESLLVERRDLFIRTDVHRLSDIKDCILSNLYSSALPGVAETKSYPASEEDNKIRTIEWGKDFQIISKTTSMCTAS